MPASSVRCVPTPDGASAGAGSGAVNGTSCAHTAASAGSVTSMRWASTALSIYGELPP